MGGRCIADKCLAAKTNVDRLMGRNEKKAKNTMASGKLVMVESFHRMRSCRMKFCVHGLGGYSLSKQY